MDIKDFLIEVEGIEGTILNYTDDEFVKSYARQIRKFAVIKDVLMVIELSNRILDWYRTEIILIKSNIFVHNQQAHIKVIELLETFISNNGVK